MIGESAAKIRAEFEPDLMIASALSHDVGLLVYHLTYHGVCSWRRVSCIAEILKACVQVLMHCFSLGLVASSLPVSLSNASSFFFGANSRTGVVSFASLKTAARAELNNACV